MTALPSRSVKRSSTIGRRVVSAGGKSRALAAHSRCSTDAEE